MPETRVLLIRHAETSAPDRFHGAESDVGLGERGRVQAELLAAQLSAIKPTQLYTSAMRRAIQTAEPIARACQLTPWVLESLHERRMGPLSGQLRESALAHYEDAKRSWESGILDATHEGGESYADIRRRVLPIWNDLVDRSLGQTVVVVVHGVVIRVILTSILHGFGPQDFSKIGIDHVAINDLRWDGTRWVASALNQVIDGVAT